MSKVGKKPIVLPEGVTCLFNNNILSIKGSKGELKMKLNNEVLLNNVNQSIIISPNNNSIKFWGTIRSLVNNMVIGVTKGFSKALELQGVGYKVALKGNNLIMNLGFSHEIIFPIPEGVGIKCPDSTHINIEGIDKQVVGLVAAKIKQFKRTEPYKGKGFKYVGEKILRKEGKKK